MRADCTFERTKLATACGGDLLLMVNHPYATVNAQRVTHTPDLFEAFFLDHLQQLRAIEFGSAPLIQIGADITPLNELTEMSEACKDLLIRVSGIV